MIKARVINRFTCISTNKTREIGDIVVYTKERAKEILSKGDYIDIIEVLPEPKTQENNEPKVRKTRTRKPKQ